MILNDLSYSEYNLLPVEKRFDYSIKLNKNQEDRAFELHNKFITIDFHSHATVNLHRKFIKSNNEKKPLFKEYKIWSINILKKILESGVTCFWENIFSPNYDFNITVNELANTFYHINNCSENYLIAHKAEDIKRAKKEGKISFIKGAEPQTVEADLSKVDVLYGLGVRCMTLTYNTKCKMGYGIKEKTDFGLSNLGLKFVEKMNQYGLLIDLSHSGEKTALETIELSKFPVAFTHNGAKALNKSSEKMRSDEEIKALTEKDGVIGIIAIPNTLSNKSIQGIAEVINHINYIVDLVGINHVAIGSDNAFVNYDYSLIKNFKFSSVYPNYMRGFSNPSEWPNIIRALVYNGYSDHEIEKISGLNVLNLIEKVIG